MVSQGVRRGDHIGVLLPNCIEFVALMLAAADIGAVLVPLNTTLPTSAVHRAFQASGVKHVVGSFQILEHGGGIFLPKREGRFSIYRWVVAFSGG